MHWVAHPCSREQGRCCTHPWFEGKRRRKVLQVGLDFKPSPAANEMSIKITGRFPSHKACHSWICWTRSQQAARITCSFGSKDETSESDWRSSNWLCNKQHDSNYTQCITMLYPSISNLADTKMQRWPPETVRSSAHFWKCMQPLEAAPRQQFIPFHFSGLTLPDH